MSYFSSGFKYRNSRISEIAEPYSWKWTTELKQFWNCHNWLAAQLWFRAQIREGRLPSLQEMSVCQITSTMRTGVISYPWLREQRSPQDCSFNEGGRNGWNGQKEFPLWSRTRVSRKLRLKGSFSKIVQSKIYLSYLYSLVIVRHWITGANCPQRKWN